MSIIEDMPTDQIRACISKARELRDEAPEGTLSRLSMEYHVRNLEEELDRRERAG